MKLQQVLLIVLLALAGQGYAQARFVGNVTEVTDGRTLVLDNNGRGMTARLQYIESPEPGQPLYETVRAHLSGLVAGKTVEFASFRMVDGLMVGRATVNGVDLSAQLIRDGAAWHEGSEASGQDRGEAAEYADHQRMAREERRGIWSVPGLKTPAELRAEHRAQADQREQVDRLRRSNQSGKVGLSQFQTENRTGPHLNQGVSGVTADRRLNVSASIFTGKGSETYGLHSVNAPDGRYTVVYSSPSFFELAGAKQKFKVEYRIAYYIAREPNYLGNEWYALYVRSIADSYKFEKRRSALVIVADGRSIPVGVPYVGATSDRGFGDNELFFYKLSRAQVFAVAKAKRVQFKIDGLTGDVAPESIALFKQLADTMR